MPFVTPSITVLRLDLKNALDRFSRATTFDNALALQKAQKALKAFFKGERGAWFIITNDNPVPDPNHVPPTHFRIIDGGRQLDG